MKQDEARVTVFAPAILIAQVRREAEREDRSVSAWIRRAIVERLQREAAA